MPESPDNPETNLLRWRETMPSEPAGFNHVVRTFERVVEGAGPIPEGATPTSDEPHDWRLEETK